MSTKRHNHASAQKNCAMAGARVQTVDFTWLPTGSNGADLDAAKPAISLPASFLGTLLEAYQASLSACLEAGRLEAPAPSSIDLTPQRGAP